MGFPLETATRLSNFFNLNQERIPVAASVVDRAYYHSRQLTPLSHSVMEHYYSLLCSHKVSETDYLNYRSTALLETT